MAREDIYDYQNHEGHTVYADPMRVLRIMAKHAAPHGGDLHHLIGLTRDENPAISFPATESLLAGVSEAFRVPLFDARTGIGLTDTLALELALSFILWLKKKRMTPTSGMLPTSPAPIPAISPPSPSMAAYPTALSSDCG